MRALSLFTGAGGMDVGFSKAGFSIVAASEMDKHACNTYAENNPDVRLFRGDLLENFGEITSLEGIDVVFGGPPCQGFSVAGKMSSDDPRSQLVFSFCDVVGKLRPKAFVMENVSSLAKLAKFKDVKDRFLARFESFGYSVSEHTLNAKNFGVPQSRERVFFIGFLKEVDIDFKPLEKELIPIKDVFKNLGKSGTELNPLSPSAKITLARNPVVGGSPYAGMLFNGGGRPVNPHRPANTLTASGGNRVPVIDECQMYGGGEAWVETYYKHLKSGGEPLTEVPKHLRRLTIKEAATIQTFPDDYVFTGPPSKVYSQIGNAVPCKLAEVVAEVVKSAMEDL